MQSASVSSVHRGFALLRSRSCVAVTLSMLHFNAGVGPFNINATQFDGTILFDLVRTSNELFALYFPEHSAALESMRACVEDWCRRLDALRAELQAQADAANVALMKYVAHLDLSQSKETRNTQHSAQRDAERDAEQANLSIVKTMLKNRFRSARALLRSLERKTAFGYARSVGILPYL